MGNRAAVTFDNANANNPAFYLHWNGGRDSIEGFLKATRILMGGRLGDGSYGMARFGQVVGTFMAGNLSFGMAQVKQLRNCDNGLYVIDSKTMTIKARKDLYEGYRESDEYDVNEFANDIIKIINAGYAVHNEGQTYPEPLLPTAEEFDAAELAELEARNNPAK